MRTGRRWRDMTTANSAIASAQKDIVTAFIKHKAAALFPRQASHYALIKFCRTAYLRR
jgi:hypothetical protein